MIEGFLDIHLPAPTHGNIPQPSSAKTSQSDNARSSRVVPEPPFLNPRPEAKDKSPKPLFTVKPGGIAGYLCMLPMSLTQRSYTLISGFLASLCNTASYVDIKAKTDTYVGFLPANALERLIEKRPIVLLTLAKRLISLLSPLSEFLCPLLFNPT